MSTRLIKSEYDQFTGITEEFWYEEVVNGHDKIHIKRFQDVEHTLAMNKVMNNAHTAKKPKYSDSDGVHHVARIPLMLVEKWIREGFNWYTATPAERAAKLNDPDYKKLKVRPGKI